MKVDILAFGAHPDDVELGCGGTIAKSVSKGKKVTNVEAKHFIIATGGRPRTIPEVKIDGKQIISSKEAMILKTPPKDMVIIGGGAIGCEFAYFYNSCGSKITMIEMMERVLPMEDEDISKELRKQFVNSGIQINTNTIVEKVEKLKTINQIGKQNQNFTLEKDFKTI